MMCARVKLWRFSAAASAVARKGATSAQIRTRNPPHSITISPGAAPTVTSIGGSGARGKRYVGGQGRSPAGRGSTA